jgi:transcriptional/translational regulatory protein YebC/TACO1
MSQLELVGSITMAFDACCEVISLQELLEIAIEQIDHPKKECTQSRTVLLLMCYLDQVKPHLDELHWELKQIHLKHKRQLEAKTDQMASEVERLTDACAQKLDSMNASS